MDYNKRYEGMTAEEWDEEWEGERAFGRACRKLEASLKLASEEGDAGRQRREDLRAQFERARAKGRVVEALFLLLNGAEGHLGLLGEEHGDYARPLLASYFGPAVRVAASRLVRRLLELGPSPAAKHKIFDAPIHGAVGNEDILRQLLSDGAAVDKDELDFDGNSPLLLAVRQGHAPSVELLLAAGVDSGVRVETELRYVHWDGEDADDWAALDFAASAGHVDLCKTLVEGGADVSAKSNGCSRTPLHAAAGRNRVGAIDALVELGAYIEGGPGGVCDDTPVEIAAKTASLEAVAALARHGASLKNALQRAAAHSELRVVVGLLEAGADPNETNLEGDAPLHKAVENWRGEEISRALLQHGARIDAPGSFGRTPLHIASSGSISRTKAQSVFDFFAEEAGAAGLDWRDQHGLTPLHVACEESNCYAVTALLSRGADTTTQDYDGNSPLHLAVNSKDVVGILLGAGARVSAANNVGSTALHLACSNRRSDAAAVLVKHDPTVVNIQNTGGDTPLYAAAAAGEEEENPVPIWHTPDCAQAPKMVDMLLRAGADESIANYHGYTPLQAPVLKYTSNGRSEPSEATKRMCALIRRAPADRAWRRRGILLLCRAAFLEKARLEPEGGRDKAAKVSGEDHAAGDDGEGRRAANGHGGCAGDLMTSLVARLFDLPEEGVFRKIIFFL